MGHLSKGFLIIFYSTIFNSVPRLRTSVPHPVTLRTSTGRASTKFSIFGQQHIAKHIRSNVGHSVQQSFIAFPSGSVRKVRQNLLLLSNSFFLLFSFLDIFALGKNNVSALSVSVANNQSSESWLNKLMSRKISPKEASKESHS